MNTVTQKMKFRQSLIKYSEKYGVTKAAIKYNVTRQYIYFWKRRYDGTLQSLADRCMGQQNIKKACCKAYSCTE